MIGSVDADSETCASDWGMKRCSDAEEISGINSGTGGVVGYVDADRSSNYGVRECHNSGKVSGKYNVSGVVGNFESNYADNCVVTGCYNIGELSGESDIGGVIGNVDADDASNCGMLECYNAGPVSSTGDSVGGVTGELGDGFITSCWNIGQVSGKECVGVVVGLLRFLKNKNMMTLCYNTGNISGTSIADGVTGRLYGSKVADCYNAGTVSGSSKTGGLVGDKHQECSVTDSYYLDACGAAGDGESKPTGDFSGGEVTHLLQGGWRGGNDIGLGPDAGNRQLSRADR